jgi:hypothetical protein
MFCGRLFSGVFRVFVDVKRKRRFVKIPFFKAGKRLVIRFFVHAIKAGFEDAIRLLVLLAFKR